MNEITKYDLIGMVIAFLNATEYDASIKSIAADCSLPLPYTRKLMLTLLKNQVLQACISMNIPDQEDNDPLESYWETPDVFKHKLMDGDFDDALWEINLSILNTEDRNLLALTHLEYGALEALPLNKLSLNRGTLFNKKALLLLLSSKDMKNKEIIQAAIDSGKKVQFHYRNKNYEVKDICCFPKEFITNTIDNWIYMRSFDSNLYRLDRIQNNCRIIHTNDQAPEYTPNHMQKYVWGVYSSEDDQPVHVKLRITPETPNIISKIKRDTKLRAETGKLYKDGDYYYYEDDVIGLGEFSRWIRQYGSSILVLEPENLKEQIKDKARYVLWLYDKVQEWGKV